MSVHIALGRGDLVAALSAVLGGKATTSRTAIGSHELLIEPRDGGSHAQEHALGRALAWLLRELGSAPGGSAGGAAALRGRWRDFEAAFGTQPGAPGGAALAQLLQLLHNTLAAAEHLPVHSPEPEP